MFNDIPLETALQSYIVTITDPNPTKVLIHVRKHILRYVTLRTALSNHHNFAGIRVSSPKTFKNSTI